MLKFMLTTQCNRKCEYCITRNIHCEEELDINKTTRTLWDIRKQGHSEIMITGGEPTLSKQFALKVLTIGLIFSDVYITTQNKEMLKKRDELHFIDAITFSLHGEEPTKVEVDIPVYAAILDCQYNKELPKKLMKLGYSGLTINEEQRGNKEFKETLKDVDGFTIRVNKRGKCMNETIILPNLKVIDDFKSYL